MSMRRPRHNFGPVDWIGAEAVGVPGQRTFRVMVSAGGNYAHLWLEKEQLRALSLEIARMLLEIDSAKGDDVPRAASANVPPKPPGFPASPDVDFQVGDLRLTYDPQSDVIALDASDRESETENPPTFRCLASKEQMEALQNIGLEVISAGRPTCPLCGTPLPAAGMPHFCPPTNGHQKLSDDE